MPNFAHTHTHVHKHKQIWLTYKKTDKGRRKLSEEQNMYNVHTDGQSLLQRWIQGFGVRQWSIKKNQITHNLLSTSRISWILMVLFFCYAQQFHYYYLCRNKFTPMNVFLRLVKKCLIKKAVISLFSYATHPSLTFPLVMATNKKRSKMSRWLFHKPIFCT